MIEHFILADPRLVQPGDVVTTACGVSFPFFATLPPGTPRCVICERLAALN